MSINSTPTGTAAAFNYASLESPVIYHQGKIIKLGELLDTVDYLSTKIPAHQHILNLYEERYYFLLGFLLALKQQSISLFPSTITAHTLAQLHENYADILVLSDDSEIAAALDLKALLKGSTQQKSQTSHFPEISLQQTVAVIFTSGSTGQPTPYKKLWSDLVTTSHLLAEQFLLSEHSHHQLSALLATVPAQHMYGLETSIMMALQQGLLIHSSKPFFPQDISDCLADFQQYALQANTLINSILITTPLHLKACIKTGIDLSAVSLFISATAPLDRELAQQCEQDYSAQVKEIFGCTEVGSMAYRRTIKSQQWTVLEDISLDSGDEHNEVQINTTRSIKHFAFNDIVDVIDNKHFLLKGRKEDLVNQGGKRTSLAYLNHHLQSYDELVDACYYQDDSLSNSQDDSRLIAFVVLQTPLSEALSQPFSKQQLKKAQQQQSKQIRDYLKNKIEAVFLPKKIIYVPQLPRNSTGKLPLSQLKKLFLQNV